MKKIADPMEIVVSDLKALLFWATVGVRKSRSGSYGNEIIEIINSYAEYVRVELPGKPRWSVELSPSEKKKASLVFKRKIKKEMSV